MCRKWNWSKYLIQNRPFTRANWQRWYLVRFCKRNHLLKMEIPYNILIRRSSCRSSVSIFCPLIFFMETITLLKKWHIDIYAFIMVSFSQIISCRFSSAVECSSAKRWYEAIWRNIFSLCGVLAIENSVNNPSKKRFCLTKTINGIDTVNKIVQCDFRVTPSNIKHFVCIECFECIWIRSCDPF